ncbi:aminodeoxychorismate lyase [Pokkaliibacter sp. CJK22405]|uniref:aminodeoxychorismate lyase n=1 Tax=Pokkaliibacter sp. CJK22405 TaxID=3384615 RepID=UPI0039856739
MTVSSLVNGLPATVVEATDRGLAYGDGLFETLRVVDGHVLLWSYHSDRLARGFLRLGFSSIEVLLSLLESELHQLLSLQSSSANGLIKLLITRGAGGRGYRADPSLTPTRVLSWHSYTSLSEEQRAKGVSLRLCQTRFGHNPLTAGLKHLNRLEQVLARSEWSDNSIFEGVVCDISQNVVSGTMSNLFIVKNGCLKTPKLELAGIDGTRRRWIIENASCLGMQVNICQLSLDELFQADEILICNAAMGIVPVAEFEMSSFSSTATGVELHRLYERSVLSCVG